MLLVMSLSEFVLMLGTSGRLAAAIRDTQPHLSPHRSQKLKSQPAKAKRELSMGLTLQILHIKPAHCGSSFKDDIN